MSAVLDRPRAKPAPTEWDRHQPYRACDLCDHGRDVGGVRHCVCAEVVIPGRSVPVQVVRKPYGTCGDDAIYLTVRGLRL